MVLKLIFTHPFVLHRSHTAYRFGTTWWWVIDYIIFIFEWTILLTANMILGREHNSPLNAVVLHIKCVCGFGSDKLRDILLVKW